MDASNGALTHLGDTAATGQPAKIAVDPTGRFLVGAEEGNPGAVMSYRIDDATGSLTPLTPQWTGRQFFALDFEPTGSPSSNGIDVYSIDSASGALAPFGARTTAGLSAPLSVTIDRGGRHLYAASSSDGTVAIFDIDPTTGGDQREKSQPGRHRVTSA